MKKTLLSVLRRFGLRKALGVVADMRRHYEYDRDHTPDGYSRDEKIVRALTARDIEVRICHELGVLKTDVEKGVTE